MINVLHWITWISYALASIVGAIGAIFFRLQAHRDNRHPIPPREWRILPPRDGLPPWEDPEWGDSEGKPW